MKGLTPAQPKWNEQGEAFIPQFDDHYFSTEDGAAESRYIFFDGNNLSQRFRAHADNMPAVIAELGFGTGLNAAIILSERRKSMHNGYSPPWLTYLAIDKHPLRSADFQRAHQRFPTFQHEFALLEHDYPEMVQGFHLRSIPEIRCRILYIWDDVCSALTAWDGQVDAWLLDGFKPSANEHMWSASLYQLMAKRSRNHSSVATYSAAGHVRRGLIAAGFQMTKRPGYGRKRHALHGVFQSAPEIQENPFQSRAAPPDWSPMCRPTKNIAAHTPQKVAVIGAGIAGATTAYALHQRGIKVSVFDAQAAVAQGGSGNRLGLGHPLLHGGVSRQGDWYDAAFLHSQNWPLSLAGKGAILAAHDDAMSQRWQSLGGSIPEHIARFIPANDAHLPYGGCAMPTALVIRPAETVSKLLEHVEVVTTRRIISHTEKNDGITLIDQQGRDYGLFHDVVVTTASNDLCPELPLITARGQVIDVDHQEHGSAWSGRHYLIPGKPALAGASYILNDHHQDLRASEAEHVLEALGKHGFDLGPWKGQGRASLRALSPDRLPYIGPLPELDSATTALRAWAGGAPPPREPIPHRQGWWCSLGHGSRGLTGACYAATMLADAICGLPPSTPLNHRQWVMPLRVLMRELRRKKKH